MGRHAAATPPPERPGVTVREMPDMAAVRARHQNASMQGEDAEAMGGLNAHTGAALMRSWQDVPALHDSLRVVAVDVLSMAQAARMPEDYWHTDRRVARACTVLGLDPRDAARIDWT